MISERFRTVTQSEPFPRVCVPHFWPNVTSYFDRSGSSERKNVMSMCELFCPNPLIGFDKMAEFPIFFFFLPKNKMFPLITWKEQAICLQKLQTVVVTLSLLNFLNGYLIAKRTLTTLISTLNYCEKLLSSYAYD